MAGRRDVERIQGELEELFSDLWQVPGFVGLRRGFRPHVDCYRSDDPPAVTVVVDLAGVEPDEVEIVVAEQAILLTGERKRHAPNCRVSYRQMEIEYGAFRRRIALADAVDPDAAHATYENGLLTVVMPLAEQPRTGRVSIALGGDR